MRAPAILGWILASILAPGSGDSGIRILPDGGYSGIVIRIGDGVNQDYCNQYIKHITVSRASLINIFINITILILITIFILIFFLVFFVIDLS